MNTRFTPLALGTIVLSSAIGFAQPGDAAILGTYQFNNGSQTATNTSNSLVNFTDVTVGDGLDDISFSAIGNPGQAFSAAGWDGINRRAATNNNDFVQFALQAINGYRVNLNSISFDAWRNAGPRNLLLRYSTDNWATFRNVGTTAPGAGFVGGQPNWGARTLTLSGLTQITNQVSFRLYGWNANDAADGTLHLDDIAIDGTVEPVPEPATILGGIAALGIGGVIRRKRQKVRKTAETLVQ